MPFYVVPRLGTGREGDPIRPDAPDGYVGTPDGSTYLIVVPDDAPLAPATGRRAVSVGVSLDVEARSRGLPMLGVRRLKVASAPKTRSG